MARSIPADRFRELLRVSQEIFISEGYARTQMDDVAKALGVGKGTIYGYVESKQALFDFVVRHTAGPEIGPIAVPDSLPLPTPAPGSTLAALQVRIAERRELPRIDAALATERPADARAELEGVVRELFDLLASNRVGIKLLERCSRDYPELGALWHDTGRNAVVDLLEHYIRERIAGGIFEPVDDTRLAARFVQETITTWAVHVHWDAAPERIAVADALAMVVHFVTRTLLG